MPKRLTAKDMQHALQQQISSEQERRAATGTANPMPVVAPGKIDGTSIISLKAVDVQPYEDNPRTEPNSKFEEIKESIRTRGLEQQLTVTRRPGSDTYILARGGKTRLLALKELAAEEERFTTVDFSLVPYSSESDLLAAHMVENLSRADMSFWDTANSYLNLRQKLSKEQARQISLREFANQLKKQGLELGKDLLGDFDFLVHTLSALGESVKQISRNDVRHLLRPQLSGLEDLRQRLFGQESAEALESAYVEWLRGFCEADKDALLPVVQALREAVHNQAAIWFGLQSDELDVLLMAAEDHKQNAQDLQQTLERYRNDANDAAGGDDGNTAGVMDTGIEDEPEDGPVFDPGRRVPGELDGIEAAHGCTLTPVSPDTDEEQDTGCSSPALTDDGQVGLTEGSPERALEAMQDCILNLTEFAGITSCLRDAPGMPLGFFMDVPETPLGASVFEPPARTWWFLVNVSGQLILDWFDLQVQPDADSENTYALYDTGEQGFRQLISNDQAWTDLVQSHLGGLHMAEGHHITDFLTEQSPLCDLANSVIQATREYRRWLESKG